MEKTLSPFNTIFLKHLHHSQHPLLSSHFQVWRTQVRSRQADDGRRAYPTTSSVDVLRQPPPSRSLSLDVQVGPAPAVFLQ
ncbi:hypothetical protein HanRHA438_Chr12g0566611 [Helianthus annuus]|nr:hypothetical protein HanRHA438_Chr12g0566611 [Helianthus annuus]